MNDTSAGLTFPLVVLTLLMLLASVGSTVVPVMSVNGVVIDQVNVDDMLLHDVEIIQVGIEDELLLDNVMFIMVDIAVASTLVLVWLNGMLKFE